MKILRVFAVLALVLMSLLPVGEMVARLFGLTGIPGAIVCVQHLTLFVAFLGAALAASSDRLLSMSANTLLPASWLPRARGFVFAVAAAVTVSLAWAGVRFVLAEREGGAILTLGLPRWPAQAIMPVGFLLIAGFGIWKVADSWKPRLASALGLLVPLLFVLAPASAGLSILAPDHPHDVFSGCDNFVGLEHYLAARRLRSLLPCDEVHLVQAQDLDELDRLELVHDRVELTLVE